MNNFIQKALTVMVIGVSTLSFTPSLDIVSSPASATSVTNTRLVSTPASADTKKVKPVTVSSTITDGRKTLDSVVVDANNRVNDTVAGGVSTTKLAELKASVDAAIAATSELFSYEIDATYGLEPFNVNIEERVAVVTTEVEARKTATTNAVVAWEAELVAEKERIAAEVARKKAEAEAQAAAEAARKNTSTGNTKRSYTPPTANAPKSNTGGGSESNQQRLNRIMAGLPFNIPVYISSSCGVYTGAAYACYNFQSTINIAPIAFTQPDCRLRFYLAHEYRHYEQHMSGLVQFDANRKITNRNWLEADATAHGSRYGC